MTVRIDWTEPSRSSNANDLSDDEDADPSNPPAIKEEATEEEELPGKGEGLPMEENECEMIWQGILRERAFRSFRSRACESDVGAKEFLGTKWEGMWDIAKKWGVEEI